MKGILAPRPSAGWPVLSLFILDPFTMGTLQMYTFWSCTVKHVGIKQARQELPNLIDRAEAGEEAR